MEGILDDIYDMVMPEAAWPIRAEAYALNVYSPDGERKLSMLCC
jgi:hypothetical protein